MKAILYLNVRQFINYIKHSLTSPKRLIPMGFGALYLLYYLWCSLPILFLGPAAASGLKIPDEMLHASPESLAMVSAVIFAILAAAACVMLGIAFSQCLIIFGLPEIDFILPAPIRRSTVMLLKLAKLYSYVLLSAAILAMLGALPAFALGFARGTAVLVGGAAIVMYTMLLVNVCVALNLIGSFRPGGRSWASTAVRGGLLLLILLAVGFTALGYYRSGDMVVALHRLITHPALIVVLAPAKWTANLTLMFLSGWQWRLVAQLLALILACVGSFLLVLSRKENPYEPSLSASIEHAAYKAAARSTGLLGSDRTAKLSVKRTISVRTPVPPFGRGAVAIAWKNLNLTLRLSPGGFVALCVLVPLMLVVVRLPAVGVYEDAGIRDTVTGIAMWIMVVVTSLMVLNSLRVDIQRVDFLKPMPVPSWQAIAAETMYGTVFAVAGAWALLLLESVLFWALPGKPLVAMAIVTPIVANALIALSSGIMVLYPDWSDPFQKFMGRLLVIGVLLLGLVLPLGVGIALNVLGLGLVFPALVTAAISIGMSALGIALGAYAFAHHDPTGE